MQSLQANSEIFCNAKDLPGCSSEIRESMSRLPKWIQGFLTWLTTQPLSNQLYQSRSGGYQVITGFLSLISGLMLSIFALCMAGNYYSLLILSLIITVSGMRKLQVVIYHHCSHGTVFKSNFVNFILGEFISVMLVVKDFRTYKHDHMAHHNSNKLLTFEDETAQDLGEIGILPGISKNVLWRRLLLSFISPFSHIRWLLNRVRNCFLSLYLIHNIIAIIFWSVLFVLISHYKLWDFFIVSWLFPLFILYNISRMLRLIAEHRWPNTEIMNSRGKIFICLSTVAVFNGEAMPARTNNFVYDFWQLVYWITKMIFVHLFVRVFILVGDTPCHDFHHRRPSSRDWASYIYERQKDKNNGCPGYPVNYSEVWGLFNAIDANLKSISEYRKK